MSYLSDTLIRGNFMQERELKRGERGAVFLLREKETGKRHVFHRFQGNSEVYEVLLGVNCPNLPRVQAVACQDGTVLVLEEYIQGDTLEFLLEERPLSQEQAREILIQICRGLKVLHGLGIVHRDIKPENIILRGDEAVLIDFDVSRVCKTEQSSDTRVMGTAGYAAPEQFGFSQTDARADIFSLGVLLNEMLTRRHPSQKLADGPLRPIIEKCIEVNVDKRYASVDELLAALREKPPKGKKLKKWWLLPAAVFLAAVWLGTTLVPRQEEQWFPDVAETEQKDLIRPIFVEPALAEQTRPRPEKEPTQPEKKPEPTPQPETDPEPEETDGQQGVSLQPEKIFWYEIPDVYATGFQYDLDGDGTAENYLFAAMYNFVDQPRMLLQSGANVDEKPEVMEVAGAVWKQSGENEYVLVEEFASLLTDCTIRVRKIAGEQAATVEEIGSLYGIWKGAIRGTFVSAGFWCYECSAVLDGETLTALGVTHTQLLDEQSAAAATVPPNGATSLQPMVLTDGEAVGDPVSLEFTTKDELLEGSYEIYSVMAQYLDNGFIRFTVDYLAPKLWGITVFDPPNGELFKYNDRSGTSGERELLIFDLSIEELQEAGRFTITFNDGNGGRFLLFVSADTCSYLLEQAHR